MTTLSTESINAIKKAQEYQTAAWVRVVSIARQYATMRATGAYIEDGKLMYVSVTDRASYEKMFIGELKSAAERALMEDIMVGTEIHNGVLSD